MRVLVTGASGFVGLHTARALLAAGHTVRLGVRNADKMNRLLQSLELPPQDLAVGEITDPAAIEHALQDCDALVHAAALVSLDRGDAKLMHQTNVLGTRAVIEAALARGLQSIVYVSSAAALYNPELDGIDEHTPLATPVSAYARSKAEAEQFVRSCIEQGANIAVTYPTGVVGPDDPGVSEGNRSLQILLNSTHINTSTGLQMIDVRDLAQAHVKLLEQQTCGRYLVAGHYLPWRELGKLLDAVTGRRLVKLPIPGAALRTMGRAVDLLSRFHHFTLPLSLEAMNFGTRWVICDDSKLRNELHMDYRSPQETVSDTIRWLAAAGQIRNSAAGKLRD